MKDQPGEAPFDLYPYDPSESAAYAYLAMFGVCALAHFILIFPRRAAWFIPMVIGCIMEGGGYYGRAWSSGDRRKTLPYILQYILIFAAPPFLAATIYMTFGRIVKNLRATDYCLISTRWLTKILVLIDVVCFVTQIAGAIMAGDTKQQTRSMGQTLVLSGLVLQLVVFGIFIIIIAVFQHRFSRVRKTTALDWKRHIVVLYAVSVLFVVRNLVRIVEFKQGDEGFILTHEVMLYVFDGTLMLMVAIIYTIIHPGRLIRATKTIDWDNDLREHEGKELANVCTGSDEVIGRS